MEGDTRTKREAACRTILAKDPNLWLMVILYDPPYNICTVVFYFCGKEGTHLNRKVSYSRHAAAQPCFFLVDFVSGSRLLLDMKPYLDKIRFRPLADARVWNSAVTNGILSASAMWS